MKKQKKRNIDITYFTNIVDVGYSYIAENFAWESAGYYWDINDINDLIENGGNINDVSSIINYGGTDTYGDRESLYSILMEGSENMFK